MALVSEVRRDGMMFQAVDICKLRGFYCVDFQPEIDYLTLGSVRVRFLELYDR